MLGNQGNHYLTEFSQKYIIFYIALIQKSQAIQVKFKSQKIIWYLASIKELIKQNIGQTSSLET